MASRALAHTPVRAGLLRSSAQPKVVHGSLVAARPAATLLSASTPKGGTACQCVCGDRVVWNREVFKGNVVKEKEHECEHEVCPMVNVPGLKVTTECNYVEDITELTEGTVCRCQCGDKLIWRSRGFYGNRVEELEQYCLKDICPRVSPVPGLRFEAQCRYDKHLFRHPHSGQPHGLHSRASRRGLMILDVARSLGFAMLGVMISGATEVLL